MVDSVHFRRFGPYTPIRPHVFDTALLGYIQRWWLWWQEEEEEDEDAFNMLNDMMQAEMFCVKQSNIKSGPKTVQLQVPCQAYRGGTGDVQTNDPVRGDTSTLLAGWGNGADVLRQGHETARQHTLPVATLVEVAAEVNSAADARG